MSFVRKLFGKSKFVMVHTVTIRICAGCRYSMGAAVILEELISMHDAFDKDWVYRPREDWQDMFVLSEWEMRCILDDLKSIGLLETKRKIATVGGEAATYTHFKVNEQQLEILILAAGEPDFTPTKAVYKSRKSSVRDSDADLSIKPTGETDPSERDSDAEVSSAHLPKSAELRCSNRKEEPGEEPREEPLSEPSPETYGFSSGSGSAEGNPTPSASAAKPEPQTQGAGEQQVAGHAPSAANKEEEGVQGKDLTADGNTEPPNAATPPARKPKPPTRAPRMAEVKTSPAGDKPRDLAFDALLPWIAGSTNPETLAMVSGSIVGKVKKYLIKRGITEPTEMGRVGQFIRDDCFMSPGPIQYGAWEKWLPMYVDRREAILAGKAYPPVHGEIKSLGGVNHQLADKMREREAAPRATETAAIDIIPGFNDTPSEEEEGDFEW